MSDTTPHIIREENAAQILNWLQTRRGICIWSLADLGDPSFSLITPLHNADGSRVTKPSWKCANNPRLIVDPAEVEVVVTRETKRFHVAVRMGGQGLSMKLTEGASRRVRKEVMRAGVDAFYEFSYDTQEAIILLPSTQVPLIEWTKSQERAA